MLIALLIYAAIGLALGIWATVRVRHQQDAIEMLLIATGLVVWWPLVVLVEAAYELRQWRQQKRVSEGWAELTADDEEDGQC